MKRVKVLIWDNFELEDKGGPFGYCYQIYEYLKQCPSNDICFLSDYLRYNGKRLITGINLDVTRKKGRFKLVNLFTRLCNYLKVGDFISRSIFVKKIFIVPDGLDFNEFDFIHFQVVSDASRFLHSQLGYNGKIILTSHCPCLFIDELFANYQPYYRLFRPLALIREGWTYRNVDYLMFPCKEARESYEKSLYIRNIFRRNEQKFFYVHSSLLDKRQDELQFGRLQDYGIPDNAFVIAYFGRHNLVKGYDLLKRIGERLLDRYDNLFFLCAGSGSIPPLEHPRWIELGFVSNISEIMPKCDLYVLPNRDTYFDLVAIECLRAGIRMAISDTGGNKYFKNFPKDMIMGISFTDVNDLDGTELVIHKLINLKYNNPSLFAAGGLSNRNLYEDRFTVGHFVTEYLEILSHLQ